MMVLMALLGGKGHDSSDGGRGDDFGALGMSQW